MVYRIDKDILLERYRQLCVPVPAVTNMSVDEVAWRKRHSYVTNVIDADSRKVIWNHPGRDQSVLERFYKALGPEACDSIESVAMDGALPYIAATRRHAQYAILVYDKFHIAKKLNDAVDAVRRQERRKASGDAELSRLLETKNRFILLKNPGRHTERQKHMLDRLCELNEPIYQAMLLKEYFLQLYTYTDPKEAQDHLFEWGINAAVSGLEPFHDLMKSFFRKRRMIINWFTRKISSAVSEGINNKIKRLKRMAYGYRDVEYFLLKVHQHCGLLSPRTPQ